MKLPSGYYKVEEKNGKTWLYENKAMKRPVNNKQDPQGALCKVGPEQGMAVRPVAAFRMGCTKRDIEDVAEYDRLSRSPYHPKRERIEAREWLVRRFERERSG